MTKQAEKGTVRPCRPDTELKKLAQDLVGNKIFMSDQLQRPEDLGIVFVCLMMMEPKDRQKLADEGVGIVYEYFDKALPRGINGYPMFMSCGTLTKEEYEKLIAYERKLRDAMTAALEG